MHACREEGWPKALQHAKVQSPLLLSSFGGLLSYFTTLMIDEQLLPQGTKNGWQSESVLLTLPVATFLNYDPMRQGSTLVLDGQVRYLCRCRLRI
jgi:hypothetical protein